MSCWPRHLATLSAALLLGACAWGPGQGFTTVAPASLALRWATQTGRVDDQGRWLTAEGWALRFTQAPTLTEAKVALFGQGASAPAAATGATFDPANPPPGYSLCHNGHCHAASGALVDYEVIAAELAGGGGAPSASAPLLSLGPVGAAPSLGAEATVLASSQGAGPYLPEGTLGGARLEGALQLQGVAEAGPGVDAPASAAVPFRLRLPVRLSQELPSAVQRSLGAEGQVGSLKGLRRVAFAMELVLPQGLLDGQDWPALLAKLQTPGAPSELPLHSEAVAAEALATAAAGLALQLRWWAPDVAQDLPASPSL